VSETELLQDFIEATNSRLADQAARLIAVETRLAILEEQTPPAPTPVPTPAPPPIPAPSLQSLFASGFEDGVVLQPPVGFYGTGAWQSVVGKDNSTGFTWPPKVWGAAANAQLQMITGGFQVTPATLASYTRNEIQTLMMGHRGTQTRALYQEMLRGGNMAQDCFMLRPLTEGGDLYVSYWLRFNLNFAAQMTAGQNWRVVFEWKTAGDYRIICTLVTWAPSTPGRLAWQIVGDNDANGGLPKQEFWRIYNTSVPVPNGGEWFKVEVFWHRSSGADGRFWMGINGQQLVDRLGPNMGVNRAQINRIMVGNLYTSAGYPVSQHIDDLMIYETFPPADAGDPPYAPH
jgi:hypothetical protein